MKSCLIACSVALAVSAQAQYAPQAMVAGSTAIHKSSAQFTAWATACKLQRGLQQIDDASYGYASLGDSSQALGAPDGGVVSLGDSGMAVLTFAQPVVDGPGFDFAVFENGFPNINDPEEAFLELAFVEVSSDGTHFTRFPARSLTQDTAQLSSVSAPSYTNARKLNNLAGKYIASYGTPFDLQELAGTPGLDINRVTHIRLVDAIGSIGARGSRDAAGHAVNDPFPTPFPGSGFDLDAVGVLHSAPTSVLAGSTLQGMQLYPNPATSELIVQVSDFAGNMTAAIHDAFGRTLMQQPLSGGKTRFSLTELAPGAYFVTLQSGNARLCTRAFSHR